MALTTNNDALQAPALYFDDFLESEDFTRFRETWLEVHGSVPPSLMDVLGAWVTYGSATQVCGSYEVFLLVVITITQWWVHRQAGEGFTVPWQQGVFLRVDTYAFAAREDVSQNQVLRHDTLNRTIWELVAADQRLRASNFDRSGLLHAIRTTLSE